MTLCIGYGEHLWGCLPSLYVPLTCKPHSLVSTGVNGPSIGHLRQVETPRSWDCESLVQSDLVSQVEVMWIQELYGAWAPLTYWVDWEAQKAAVQRNQKEPEWLGQDACTGFLAPDCSPFSRPSHFLSCTSLVTIQWLSTDHLLCAEHEGPSTWFKW